MTDVFQPGTETKGAEIPVPAAQPAPPTPLGRSPADGHAPAVAIDAAPPPPAAASSRAPSPGDGRIFDAGSSSGEDVLGLGAGLHHLAELAAHSNAGTPLTIGIFGGAGTGKSFALDQLLGNVEALAAGAAGLGSASPFLERVVVARVNEWPAGEAPVATIATALHTALNKQTPDGTSYAAIAQEASHSIRDPQVVAREAGERLMETRRRLDAERQILDDLTLRRSRLTESVLFEAAGSRIDTYARKNRSQIESRLRAFGFADEDPIATYKGLVREMAENSGVPSRISAFLQAIFGFRGQGRLIILAIVFTVLAWLCGYAERNQAVWIGWLTSNGGFLATVAAWCQVHIDLLPLLRRIATFLAIAMLAIDVFRAFRFLEPLFRGAAFLSGDLDGRKRDLESLISHQTRRVDSLVAEGEAQARLAEESERRAANAEPGTPTKASLFDGPFGPEPGGTERDRLRLARAFIASVGEACVANTANERGAAPPERIVVGFDNLDRLSADDAAAVLEAANATLSTKGFVTIVAADPMRMAGAWGDETAERLERFIEIPFHLREAGAPEASRLAHALLSPVAARPARPAVDSSRSSLDRPLSADEAALVEQLAPLAGGTPRKIKRFVNLYRLARARSEDTPTLALILALHSGGTDAERSAIRQAVTTLPPDATLTVPANQPRLAEALALVAKARGRAPTGREIMTAAGLVRSYEAA